MSGSSIKLLADSNVVLAAFARSAVRLGATESCFRRADTAFRVRGEPRMAAPEGDRVCTSKKPQMAAWRRLGIDVPRTLPGNALAGNGSASVGDARAG